MELDEPMPIEKVVYVPIYPSLYTDANTRQALPMLVTLSLRNVSETSSVVVTRVEAFDSDGRSLETYVDGPHDLGPMESADFVTRADRAGGSGANFVVTWGRRGLGPDLLVEAVMQSRDDAGISFTTRGYVVTEHDRVGRASRPDPLSTPAAIVAPPR